MARPRSPFTYKQWNSDMLRRWQPNESTDAETAAATSPTPMNPDVPPTASANNPQRVASNDQPGQNPAAVGPLNPPNAGEAGCTHSEQQPGRPA